MENIELEFDRRKDLINSGRILYLGIEGKFTNLTIWKSRLYAKINPDNSEGIFMRIQKYQQYSVPLLKDTLSYIKNKKSPVHSLGVFDFPTSVDNLDEILKITIKLKERKENVLW